MESERGAVLRAEERLIEHGRPQFWPVAVPCELRRRAAAAGLELLQEEVDEEGEEGEERPVGSHGGRVCSAGCGGFDKEAEVEEGAVECRGDGHVFAQERLDDGIP